MVMRLIGWVAEFLVVVTAWIVVLMLVVSLSGCKQPDWPIEWDEQKQATKPFAVTEHDWSNLSKKLDGAMAVADLAHERFIELDKRFEKIEAHSKAIEEQLMNHSVALARLCNPHTKAIVGHARYLVVYTGAKCEPCIRFKKVIEQVENAGYSVQVADIDNMPDWAKGFKPEKIPLVIVAEDSKIVKQWDGYIGYEDVHKYLRGDDPPELPATRNTPPLTATESDSAAVKQDTQPKGSGNESGSSGGQNK